MPIRQLRDFLDGHGIEYVTITHSPAFTAQEVAASAHVAGKELAKTVVVNLDDRMVMAVVPAFDKVDLAHLRDAAGAAHVALAGEWEFKDRFPDCELGAMPPFGNLYGMDVFVADSLADRESIAFNAGSHTEVVRISFDDFARLIHPAVIALTTKH
jgi:Ala-tRNA(Pro) deacylase